MMAGRLSVIIEGTVPSIKVRSATKVMADNGPQLPNTKRTRSARSISNGVTHEMPRPTQALGILIRFVETEGYFVRNDRMPMG